MAKATLTKKKAKKMLKHDTVRGKGITKKQRGYFGAVAGGTARKGRRKQRKRK